MKKNRENKLVLSYARLRLSYVRLSFVKLWLDLISC